MLLNHMEYEGDIIKSFCHFYWQVYIDLLVFIPNIHNNKYGGSLIRFFIFFFLDDTASNDVKIIAPQHY